MEASDLQALAREHLEGARQRNPLQPELPALLEELSIQEAASHGR
jgi:hypothetical protein